HRLGGPPSADRRAGGRLGDGPGVRGGVPLDDHSAQGGPGALLLHAPQVREHPLQDHGVRRPGHPDHLLRDALLGHLLQVSAAMFGTQASTIAETVDYVFLIILILCVAFLVFLTGLMIYFTVRYRRSRSPNPQDIAHNFFLEATWTGLPLIIF